MRPLTFRISARQLRGLSLFVLALGGAAVAWAGVGMVAFAISAGLVALIGLWALVMYIRAFTECTPTGIRTRGLAGTRECRWADVAAIVARPYGRTTTVMLTTTAGGRFRLGAPVAGGVMGDPEFPAKVAQIRQYWHVAVTSSADITLPADITAAPLPAWWLTADLPGPTGPRVGPPAALPAPARRRPSGMRAVDLFSTACFVLAGLAAVGALVIAPFALGPAIRAAHGTGTPGVFTAQDQLCTRAGCIWDGTFRSDHGTILQADYGDAAPPGTHPGSSFPALWPGGSNDVYAAHGSTGWVQIVLVEVGALVLLAALVWYGPIRYIRKRGWHVRRVEP